MSSGERGAGCGAPRREASARVLFVEWNEDGTVGGSHQVLFDLAVGLDRNRYEPVALFYQANRFCGLLEAEGIAVEVYEDVRRGERDTWARGGTMARCVGFLAGIARRTALLRRARIDLVHLINSPWHGADLWLPACRILRIPCVATAGALLPDELSPLQRRVVCGFDRVLAVSRSVARRLEQFGVSRGLEVVYPGVALASFRAEVRRSRAEVRTELGVGDGEIMVTMVGNFRPWKGQHVALEALARMSPEARSRVRLNLVGAIAEEHRDYVRELEALVQRRDLTSCVTFLGERRDVADLMNASDVALHASLSPEPFGLVVVEALAVGTPVLASNRGGPVEILTDDCGRLFDPDDPGELAGLFEQVIADPTRFARMSPAARERAEQFTVDRMTSQVYQIYQSLLAAP